VKALADAVGLWVIGFRLGVLDVVQGQVQLVIMLFWPAAVFRPTISHNADQPNALLFEEWQHTIIEQVGSSDRRFGRVQLDRRPIRVRIDKGLLVNASDAFDSACIFRLSPCIVYS
jgi:hypothetical protein